MDAMECILTRRSVRRYTAEMPSRELVEKTVKAGLYAPSGMNRQETVILAVTDKKVRDSLAADNASVMGATNDPFYGAPCVLAVLYKKDCFTGIYDGSLVMSNLLLAAHANGLSSCWIHRAREVFAMPKWQSFLKDHGIDGEYEGVGFCILGYCDGAYPEERERREGRTVWVTTDN